MIKLQIVEIDKRTRVGGFCLLPGTRLEFNTLGQANTFINRNGGKINANKPDKPERKPKKPTDNPKVDRPVTKTGDIGPSKEHASPFSE